MAESGWFAADLHHPCASRDLERQTLHYVALGPSLRWGDGDAGYGVAFRTAAFISQACQADVLSYSGETCQRRGHEIR